MSRLSISTWTLHHLLGRAWYDEDADGKLTNRSSDRPVLSLVDVPETIVEHGIRTLEICHFHFPAVDAGYLDKVRAALDMSGVELFSVLIDAGDIVHPDRAVRERDLRFVRDWMARAALCGASHVRVIAGDQEPTELAVTESAKTLSDLSLIGADLGLKVLTENFKTLAKEPETVLSILDRCTAEVGLCADFGNFPTVSRESDLEAIIGRADSVHAKADYDASGEMEQDDFETCLEIVQESSFDGPISLIYQHPADTWSGVEQMKEIVAEYV